MDDKSLVSLVAIHHRSGTPGIPELMPDFGSQLFHVRLQTNRLLWDFPLKSPYTKSVDSLDNKPDMCLPSPIAFVLSKMRGEM